ncbi:MAG: tetratricopeptide repeat protein [Acidobacteria bacterium]|nr:tetratricopeptide repeat protein [Acidobacteriota bacterium]
MQAISIHREWSSRQALILVTLCLSAGIVGGWLIRGIQGSSSPALAQSGASLSTSANLSATSNSATAAPNPARLKEMADAQAAPLLAKLDADPKNPSTLADVANLYYDAQQYSVAVDFYSRSLQLRPSDASVRTDMATAYWYMGNTDEAISQFNKALENAPTNPNTLFNLGLVMWQGKHDSSGAIALWKKLLEFNPNYAQKDKVLQMLSDVQEQTPTK